MNRKLIITKIKENIVTSVLENETIVELHVMKEKSRGIKTRGWGILSGKISAHYRTSYSFMGGLQG